MHPGGKTRGEKKGLDDKVGSIKEFQQLQLSLQMMQPAAKTIVRSQKFLMSLLMIDGRLTSVPSVTFKAPRGPAVTQRFEIQVQAALE